ncbi:MAG: ATP-binding cassette domain-containing protein, partial [Eggerthella lenta]
GSWEMDALCRRVGSVFQNPRSQFFNLDTTSEVAFGCENLGLSRAEMHRRVDGAFALLGIEHLRDRDIRALSGGQRQMVAIASVCAMGPDVFVLDEPTASLDVGAMLQLAEAVARLGRGQDRVVPSTGCGGCGARRPGVVMRAARARRGRPPSPRSARTRRARRPARLGPGAVSLARRSGGPAARRAPPTKTPALDAAGLEAGYGRDAPVLRGAGLRLDAGTVTALVGRNGAGKTTLSRCLVGLHRERAGSVRFRGEEPRRRDRPEHAYLVMQETGYQLFSDTVRGELLGALTHGGLRSAPDGADGQADRALARFGLEDIAERHPLSLSGGQRQRLAIAVGILQGARVLVLDEPTSGLDFGTMGRVADEVRRARDAGACIVVVTHDYEFVCAACDQVAVLEDGVVSDVLPVRGEALGRIRRAIGIDGRARPL